MSAKVHDDRYSAELDAQERILFLVGMRINRLRSVRSWVPVFAAMPRMLRELESQPELGMLGARNYVSGRVIMALQYWRSVEDLHRYARAPENLHLPAWKAFHRKAAGSGAVGIFHETYRITAGSFETVYSGMPTFGLAAATQHVPAERLGRSAARRLRRQGADMPAVD